jgi:hypothetical protein
MITIVRDIVFENGAQSIDIDASKHEWTNYFLAGAKVIYTLSRCHLVDGVHLTSKIGTIGKSKSSSR